MVARWQTVVPGAVECLVKDLPSFVAFFQEPQERWLCLRTTNLIERCFKEFRKRPKIMDSLQGEESCLRIFNGIAQEINTRWEKYTLLGYTDFTQAA